MEILKRYEPNCEARMTECLDGEHFLVSDVVALVEEEKLRLQAVTRDYILAGRQLDVVRTRGAVRGMEILLKRLRSSTT